MTSEEVLARATEASAKIAELDKEGAECRATADALEEDARKNRARAFECKKQKAEWATALQQLNVQRSVMSAEESAKRSQASAEQTLARLAEKEKQLDEALAKAKEAKPEA